MLLQVSGTPAKPTMVKVMNLSESRSQYISPTASATAADLSDVLPSSAAPLCELVPARVLSSVRKGGRRPKLKPQDDLILAREVCEANLHVDGYGKI